MAASKSRGIVGTAVKSLAFRPYDFVGRIQTKVRILWDESEVFAHELPRAALIDINIMLALKHLLIISYEYSIFSDKATSIS